MFQVIPPRGGYPARLNQQPLICGFKSYPRVGGIYFIHFRLLIRFRFKSYPRVGGISGLYAYGDTLRVSSHTPAWGVSFWEERGMSMDMFQVIPPRGGYQFYLNSFFITSVFQVIPPRGGYRGKVKRKEHVF